MLLNMIKNISRQQQTFSDGILEAFPSKSRTRKGCSLNHLPVSTVEGLEGVTKQQVGRKRSVADIVIVVLENLTQNG